jgi:hypothetical protein
MLYSPVSRYDASHDVIVEIHNRLRGFDLPFRRRQCGGHAKAMLSSQSSAAYVNAQS